MKKLIIIATLMILTACGPVIDTQTRLTLPEDAAQRIKIDQCTSAHTNCKGIERNLRQTCELYHSQQNHQYWEMCKDATNKHEDYCRTLWLTRFLPPNCPEADKQLRDCSQDYQNCVSNHGGRIEYYQCCVSNCSQAPGLPLCGYRY